ncbi:hypothetical protein ACFL6C_08145, partial [Myxococcota bacterium]
RFDHISDVAADVVSGSPDIMGAVTWKDQVLVAGFDGGLFRLVGDAIEIDALAVFGDAVWLGTRGGLLRLTHAGLEQILDSSIHDLAVGPRGLAVASSTGLFVVPQGTATLARQDLQRGVATRSFMSVTWHGDLLFAGGMEGLYWFALGGGAGQLGAGRGFVAGWVTALNSDGDRLLVGTYDEGVYAVTWKGSGMHARHVEGLEHQWVPPHAIRRINDAVWIGGLGMPPVRWCGNEIVAVDVPVRDVNDFLPVPGGVLLSTSEGPVTLEIADTRIASK